MQQLLAPGGCPWDREQSFASLRRYVLEEACEVIDAIDGGNPEELREELGDLLLQIVFQAELARAQGWFGPDDVVATICDKLERRHPHVFGSLVLDDADQVRRNWVRIKQREKQGRSLLAGIPRSLPALTRAQRVGEQARTVGFDWKDASGPRDKVREELDELDVAVASGATERVQSELGDVLFALVNLARHLGVDPERALRSTTDRFAARFAHVERRVQEQHGGFDGGPGDGAQRVPVETLDSYWEEAKDIEKETP
jgi:tetrapyrrole methylase family protein/MazG family protein/ATP diphosphatase